MGAPTKKSHAGKAQKVYWNEYAEARGKQEVSAGSGNSGARIWLRIKHGIAVSRRESGLKGSCQELLRSVRFRRDTTP
jgi:hypothetical protein